MSARRPELRDQARPPLLLAAVGGPSSVLPELAQELGPPEHARVAGEFRPERPHELRRPRTRHPEQPLHVPARQQIPVQRLELPDGVRDGEEPPGLGGHQAAPFCGVTSVARAGWGDDARRSTYALR